MKYGTCYLQIHSILQFNLHQIGAESTRRTAVVGVQMVLMMAFILKKKVASCTVILKNNACHGIFRHFCGFSFFVCHLYAWFCVCVLSWEVWTVTSLSTVLVSVCAYKWSEILASRERQHACTLLKCSLVCVWCHGCATVLTVSFHWRCMLAVFVFFVTFWCTQPEQSLYVLWHCLSLLAPSAISFFFWFPLSAFHFHFLPRRHHSSNTLSCMFFRSVCHQDDLL